MITPRSRVRRFVEAPAVRRHGRRAGRFARPISRRRHGGEKRAPESASTRGEGLARAGYDWEKIAALQGEERRSVVIP